MSWRDYVRKSLESISKDEEVIHESIEELDFPKLTVKEYIKTLACGDTTITINGKLGDASRPTSYLPSGTDVPVNGAVGFMFEKSTGELLLMTRINILSNTYISFLDNDIKNYENSGVMLGISLDGVRIINNSSLYVKGLPLLDIETNQESLEKIVGILIRGLCKHVKTLVKGENTTTYQETIDEILELGYIGLSYNGNLYKIRLNHYNTNT